MNSTQNTSKPVAVVAGVGAGLGLGLCNKLLSQGYMVAGLSRTAEPQPQLGGGYLAIACDITDAKSIDKAILHVERNAGTVTVYIHNAASLLQSPFLQTSEEAFTQQWQVSCLGAMLGIQRVIPGMLAAGCGTILVTGATASLKAGANFAAFASAKFALRGLSQSLAREYGPAGIHVAHIVLDGAVWGWQAEHTFGRDPYDCLQPADIAESYWHLIKQPRSSWTHEMDLRPDTETF